MHNAASKKQSPIPVHHVHWKRSWRIISTRYPDVNLFERVTKPEDRAAVNALESMTNPRERQARGEVIVLRPGDHFLKTASPDIKSAFSHFAKGRFSNGTFGVFYTASTQTTAIYEKAHHHIQFLQATKQGPMTLQMRVMRSEVDADLHDLRGFKKEQAALYHPTHYVASQALALELWNQGAEGIVYDSVRHDKGQCAAVFSPQAIRHCFKDRILIFEWNGKDTIIVAELKEFLKFPKGK